MQLEVVKFRDLLQVTSARLVENLGFPALEVTGEDFSNVEDFIVNEVPSPEFIILNKHTAIIQLPDAAIGGIRTIAAISSDFTRTTEASQVKFLVGDKTKTVSGVLKLTQLFAKWLLQTPGSDIFNPERGGGAQEIAGKINSTRDLQPVKASLTRSVESTATQIRAGQINETLLPPSERLLRATIIDIATFESEMEARVRILIESQAGSRAVAELGL